MRWMMSQPGNERETRGLQWLDAFRKCRARRPGLWRPFRVTCLFIVRRRLRRTNPRVFRAYVTGFFFDRPKLHNVTGLSNDCLGMTRNRGLRYEFSGNGPRRKQSRAGMLSRRVQTLRLLCIFSPFSAFRNDVIRRGTGSAHFFG